MVFFLETPNIWQQSWDLWFANFFIEIFIIHGLVWIFLWISGWFECISSMFCLKLLQIIHFKRCAIKDDLQKHYCFIGNDRMMSCAQKKTLGPVDLKIYRLERNPRLWLDSWQSLETCQNYIWDFHIWIGIRRKDMTSYCSILCSIFHS